jgi:hypothetical protein
VALTDVNREERDGGMDRLVRWNWLMVFGIEMCRGGMCGKMTIGISGTNVIIHKIMTEKQPKSFDSN